LLSVVTSASFGFLSCGGRKRRKLAFAKRRLALFLAFLSSPRPTDGNATFTSQVLPETDPSRFDAASASSIESYDEDICLEDNTIINA
jgi:hypothetical protein